MLVPSNTDLRNAGPAGSQAQRLPGWVPEPARHYLAHTECGRSIRAIARGAGVHPSTILRQVRRYEARRDDPLVDGALRSLSNRTDTKTKGDSSMNALTSGPGFGLNTKRAPGAMAEDAAMDEEFRRVLVRMAETGAVMAVARDMDMAVVVRDGADGETQRTATVRREVAQALALKDWIASTDPDQRVARYTITAAGRQALRDYMGSARMASQAEGFAEAQASFDPAAADPLLHHMRGSLAESPLVGLARRRDKDGKPFLGKSLVSAGERLRDDYELSILGQTCRIDWERVLTEGVGGLPDGSDAVPPATRRAMERVAGALVDLGPGLGEVALSVCCQLEGMEALEKRMGWSARSGKIVLRIALQRLAVHYDRVFGKFGPLIG